MQLEEMCLYYYSHKLWSKERLDLLLSKGIIAQLLYDKVIDGGVVYLVGN